MFELFNKGLINKKSLLILNYAKLNITEKQLAIILLILELSNDEAKSFTPSQLSEYMTMDRDAIEKEMSYLVNKNLVSIEQKNRRSVLNFTPLFTRILIALEEELSKNSTQDNFDYISKIVAQKLTTAQVDELNEFLDKGISQQKVKALIIEKQIKNYPDLIKELNLLLKTNKPLKITKYNWLND
ncbi:putative dnad-like replication protein [Spiroplasma clarkii]|uniref:DnaD N-terminal domain-containing protein n=1 Tax=Spiroplasma clarkii TaxID=2139 RepID=A0A1Y0L214_9MOLU|nr:DnaD family protein [Spiroplasma clarkii]ARU92027.1 putative dnad-like replication protein [Spiroplasma clarkii]ATX71357.1 hypothetical protein SCLAR_v1c10570 [Spiroplasma clarkii]